MTYPNAHLYLTAHWVVAGTAEQGQFGLRFDSAAPASQALVDGATAILQTLWAAATMAIPQQHRLAFGRLASIAPNGLYVPGTIAYDHNIAGTQPGGGASGNPQQYPLQVAHVMSLHTAFARGQAHAGRVYLPPIDELLGAGYLWSSAQVTNRNNTFASRMSDLNAAMPGPLTIFSKGTKAAPAVGAKHPVTSINSDTRPDVQRRRANQQTKANGIPANVV